MFANSTGWELAWVGMGIVWTVMTLWGSWTVWGDYAWVRTHPDRDPQVQAELLDRTRTDLRYEASSLLGGLLITYLGARAALLPPNPAAPEIWAQVGAMGATLYAAVKTIVSVQNRLTRRRFDARLNRKAG